MLVSGELTCSTHLHTFVLVPEGNTGSSVLSAALAALAPEDLSLDHCLDASFVETLAGE